jgi:hypothetical protein
MDDDLSRLGQVPLQVTGQPRALIEHAEQDRRYPLAAWDEDLARAKMRSQWTSPPTYSAS